MAKNSEMKKKLGLAPLEVSRKIRLPRPRRGLLTGFTLVEILVVFVIMMTLLGLGLAVFRGFGRGRELEGAGKNLASSMDFARNYAINNNKNCQVVFALNIQMSDIPSSYGNNQTRTAMANRLRYHAYKIYSPRDSKTIEDWRYLPETVLVDTTTTGSPPSYDPSTLLNQGDDNIPFPNDGDQTPAEAGIVPPTPSILASITFKPNGGATASGSIRLTNPKRTKAVMISVINVTGRIRMAVEE